MPTIYLPIPKSSSANPIWFFNKFTSYDIITLAKQSFYPDLTDPTIWEDTRFIYSVDKEKECVTVEYVVSETNNEETGEPENDSSVTVYYFKSEFEKFLRREHDKSILLIANKMEKFLKRDKAKYFIHNLLPVLSTRIKEIESLPHLVNYKEECQRPFKGLIRSIYSDYSSYTLKPDSFILSILNEKQITKNIYEPESISPKICKQLMDLRDLSTELVFPFYNPKESNEPPADIEKRLRDFVEGNFKEIKEPICFFDNVTEAYYFISRVASIQGFKGSDIEAADIFMMKKNKFSCSSYYTAIIRINDKRSGKKELIDELIEKNIT